MEINFKECKYFNKVLRRNPECINEKDVLVFALEAVEHFSPTQWELVFGSMIYSFNYSIPKLNDDIINIFRSQLNEI